MTAQELADLHARCFDEGPRAWNAAEFESFLTSRTEIVLSDAHALGVIRIVAGEAEVELVAPDRRRCRSASSS